MIRDRGAVAADRLGQRSVVRPRLESLFDRVTEAGVLLVTAGAGYGKTTALASWAFGLHDVAVAWISCSEAHDDPHYLAERAASALPDMIPDQPIETLSDIADALGTARAVIVLDDAHRLRSPAAWRAIEDLLQRRPESLHVVICGRDEEGLPWHRLRARGEVTEVHADDLCFTVAEATALLCHTYGIDDAEEVAGELVESTCGWAAGLCLAGHAIRNGATTSVDRSALGRSRYIRKYFDDELIAALRDDQVEFLEVTALLQRLDPELCDLLTGRSDSHELLEHLVEHNLFTTQVSAWPPAFRYHDLLSEHLRARASRLGTDTIADKLAMASRWYEEHDLPDLAIEAAVRSGDAERVELLIREASGSMLRAGFPHTVVRWLSALPEESLDSNPDLALLFARAAGATGDLLAARAGLATAERALRSQRHRVTPSLHLAHATLIFVLALWEGDLDRAAADLERAAAIADEHRTSLDHDMFGLDPVDLGAYRAILLLMKGDLDASIHQVEHILTPAQLVQPGKEAVLAVGVRALAMAWRGEPHAAREAVEQCRAAAATFRGRTGGLLALLVAGAWCADLDVARSDLDRARAVANQVQLPIYRLVYLLADARVALRTGQWQSAATSLEQARGTIADMPSCSYLATIIDDLDVELTAVSSDAVATRLTDRELLVLRRTATVGSRREAAAQLYLSVNTVKTYLRSAYKKLGAQSLDEAIGRAQELGVLDSSDR